MQKQSKIDHLEEARIIQDQALKEKTREAEFFIVETKNLEQKLHVLNKRVIRKSEHRLWKDRAWARRNRLSCVKIFQELWTHLPKRNTKLPRNDTAKYDQLLKERDTEIETLKTKLARRPDDAIHKLYRSQWEKRELNKELMAKQGLLTGYQTSYQNMKEENQRLKHELNECKLKLKKDPLPPVPAKKQVHSESKPEKYESRKRIEVTGKMYKVLPPIGNNTADTSQCPRK